MNPGSRRRAPRPTIHNCIKRTVHLAFKGHIHAAAIYFLAEGLNVFDNSILAPKTPRMICNLCGTRTHRFRHLSCRDSGQISWNSVCPGCDSRKRHRGLQQLYGDQLQHCSIQSILHFAPETVFADSLRNLAGSGYRTTDFSLEDVDFPGEDIQSLSFEDDRFDVVLCNHVLEHVANDEAAIQEIHRVLKPDGLSIVTVPGNWRRQQTVTFSKLTPNGHYREYGRDLISRLGQLFHSVETKDLSDYNKCYYPLSLGIEPYHDLAFICKKRC